MVKRGTVACATLLSLLLGASVHAETVPRPTFASPVLPKAGALCSLSFTAARSPDNGVLSILRTAKTTSDKDLLEVDPTRKTDAVDCSIDIVFERPLTGYQTLSLDLRGDEIKMPRSRLDLTIAIGAQRHRYTYAQGAWLEGGTSRDMKRFTITLPPGARAVRFRMRGSAASLDGRDSALIAFDALDMCFVDPEHPEFCGAPGQPNKRAGE